MHQAWDTPDLYLSLSSSALSSYERAYLRLKHLIIGVSSAASRGYVSLRSSASRIDSVMLLPVRDYVILPSFAAAEYVVVGAWDVANSPLVEELAARALSGVEVLPLGRAFIKPGIVASYTVGRATWQVVRYPIPSPYRVAELTTRGVTGVKSLLTKAGREGMYIVSYCDMSIQRALARWR